MSDIKVEKGVEMPPVNRTRAGRKPKYPFRDMEVGDSFVFPSAVKRKSTYAIVSRASRSGRKFATREMPDGSVRCWRVE